MKCDICGRKIETTFLNKVVGTVMRNSKGKKKTVCNECQKHNTAEELKEKL
jgi:hypothetical protein